jgi:HSP20 family protein
MSLIPWRNKHDDGPGRALAPLAELRHEMDRLFDAFFRGDDLEDGPGSLWTPAVDVEEHGNQVTVRAEVPGVDPKDLEISVLGDRLTVSGEKRETQERTEGDVYHREVRYGSFRRSVQLPAGVDPEKVSADYANGVLTVKLEKSAAAQPKRIPVKTV